MVDTLPDVTENSPELVKVSQKILNRTEIDNQDNIDVTFNKSIQINFDGRDLRVMMGGLISFTYRKTENRWKLIKSENTKDKDGLGKLFQNKADQVAGIISDKT